MKIIRKDQNRIENMGPGVNRKVLCHSRDMMIVEVEFDSGAVVQPHSHPHEQISYVQSGRFIFESGEEKEEAGPGDSLLVASQMVHGVICLQAGIILDFFTPAREDFL